MADAAGLAGQVPVGSQPEMGSQVPGGMQVTWTGFYKAVPAVVMLKHCCLVHMLHSETASPKNQLELLRLKQFFSILVHCVLILTACRFLNTILQAFLRPWLSSCSNRAFSLECFGSNNTLRFNKLAQTLQSSRIINFHWPELRRYKRLVRFLGHDVTEAAH